MRMTGGTVFVERLICHLPDAASCISYNIKRYQYLEVDPGRDLLSKVKVSPEALSDRLLRG